MFIDIKTLDEGISSRKRGLFRTRFIAMKIFNEGICSEKDVLKRGGFRSGFIIDTKALN